MKALILIPARGGSKGIPHKNRKPLAGKPLIGYSIEVAKQLAPQDDICISTDDPEIISIAQSYGLNVPFVRPHHLAQDTSGTYEVIIHALDFYANLGREYDVVVLLQPTSPFRTAQHVRQAMKLYSHECDMVVSVTEARSNPYHVMFREDADGFLHHLMGNKPMRRQDAPTVYEYNGAIYVMNVQELRQKHLANFTRNRKYLMPQQVSVDLDTQRDWLYAEWLMQNPALMDDEG
ncbi:acylneuraminate cytidylyltransferase family protein [Bacteroides sp. OttesenSCG-928-D19]|nr:acylneuraminate cytidylyltransferase family protein [Bacteroides sp. OttesenSCG-928-D19]